MSEHCPKDGGFIGDAGCTHPNHEHSELVKSILSGSKEVITASEAEAALHEGFYVDGANNVRIGFGKRLLEHIDDQSHSTKDAENRKRSLLQAIETVKYPDKVEWHHEGLEGRTAYTKSFERGGILAVSDREGKNIEYVFTIIPKRSLKRKPL